MTNQLTITGYSTALFSTWYFCEEMGILFDCGDGICSGLLQKSRKVKHVFLSHADRDHLGGLFQFCQLNGRPGLKIYYPKDCGSFPHIKEFTSNFDPHTTGSDQDMLNYIYTVCDKVKENEMVMTQIANNTDEQALLGDFRTAVDDAIIDSGEAHENQKFQLLSDPLKIKKFAKIVFDLIKNSA